MEQTVAEQFDFLLSQIDKRDLEELDRTLSEEDSASHSAQFPVARARSRYIHSYSCRAATNLVQAVALR